MIPLRIEGATRRLAEGQDEFLCLSIRDVKTIHGDVMLSSWELTPSEKATLMKTRTLGCGFFLDGDIIPAGLHKLSDDEVEMIRRDCRILLAIGGSKHPPVCPWVGQPDEEYLIPAVQHARFILQEMLEP